MKLSTFLTLLIVLAVLTAVVALTPVCIITAKSLQPHTRMPRMTLQQLLVEGKTGDVLLIDDPKNRFKFKYPPLLMRQARNSEGHDIAFTHVGVLVRASSGRLCMYSSATCINIPQCNSMFVCQCEHIQYVETVIKNFADARFAWRPLSQPVPHEEEVRRWVDAQTHPLTSRTRHPGVVIAAWLGVPGLARLCVPNPQCHLMCSGTCAQMLQAAGVSRADDPWMPACVSPHDFASDDCSFILAEGFDFGPIKEVVQQ